MIILSDTAQPGAVADRSRAMFSRKVHTPEQSGRSSTALKAPGFLRITPAINEGTRGYVDGVHARAPIPRPRIVPCANSDWMGEARLTLIERSYMRT